MKKRFLVLGITLVMVVALIVPSVALAADPILITVSAKAISITNSQSAWAIGTVEVGNTRWFNSDSTVQNDTFSQIENTGSVAVDIQIQGTTIEGGAYDWALAGTAGDQIYSLYANSEGTPTNYNVEVKSSAYGDLTLNLATSDTYDWSMEFTAPTIFNASEAGAEKTASVTLVAREQGS